MPRKSHLSIDIVIPVFNEAGVVEQTYSNLCTVVDSLSNDLTIYYVNDGSTNSTSESLAALAKNDKRIQVIELSRNFGHQAALTAGLDASPRRFGHHDGLRWPASAGTDSRHGQSIQAGIRCDLRSAR